jgi:hypothetical protein
VQRKEKKETHKTRTKRVVYMKKEKSPGNLDLSMSTIKSPKPMMPMAKPTRSDVPVTSVSSITNEGVLVVWTAEGADRGIRARGRVIEAANVPRRKSGFESGKGRWQNRSKKERLGSNGAGLGPAF